MYPAKFDYAAPATLREALALLTGRDDEARVLAGGQSLIPLLKLRFASPGLLVDLGRIPGLGQIQAQAGALRVGARVSHAALERSALIAERAPLVGRTAAQVADPLVRNLGTLCGSLAHADPRGDWGAAMLAMGAEVQLRSTRAERWVSLRDFFRGTFETALEPGEIIESVRIPIADRPAAGTYLKLERKVGDFATVGVAVQLEMEQGRIARAGIGLAAVGPRTLHAERAEALLTGAEPSAELFAEAAQLAAQAAEPADDVRGSARYKRHVVAVYTERALAQSAREIEQSGGGRS